MEGEQRMDVAINTAKYHIEQFSDIMEFIIDGNPYLYQELYVPRYFQSDFPKLLLKIKQKIESLE